MLVLVGRIARAHGNKGELIVNLETDFPEDRFRSGEVLLVGPEDAARPMRIGSVRFHRGRPIISLEGIETITAADALAGQDLWVSSSSRGPLPEGTYYRDDLIGCRVIDAHGTALGSVTAVEGPMERTHLVVDGPRGEMLIPLAADICADIDPHGRRIVVNPPQGLLELNERKPGS